MTRIFNSEIECSNEVQRLKILQKHHPLRPEVIPPELANSSQWIVWSYEVGGRKDGKFGPDKIAYQARNPWLKSSRWNASDWSDLTIALQCVKDNPYIDGIGYFFSKNDGLTGIDFDNCRDFKTGRIRKEYQFWIDRLNGYTEVSPSGTGIKIWVKGTIDGKYFGNDESTGFCIQNFADGIIEIYRRGQYFTVTTQFLEGFEHIKPAQEELDVLSEFYRSRTRNTLSGGWVSGEHVPDVVGNLPERAKAHLGESTINDIQFSSDGTRLAVAKGIGIWIYDADTGKELFLLGGYTRNVTSVVFSPNGCQFASGGEDGTIHLWDTTTGTHLKTYTMNNVKRVIFSPDRHTVATMSWENSLRLCNVATGNLRQTLTADFRSVFLSVVFSPSGGTLAISEGKANVLDGACPISLWDASTGKQIKTLTVVYGGAFSMAFSPDGHILANDSGIWGHGIELWDTSTGKHFKTLTGHKECVYSLAFSPNGLTLACGCGDGTVLLWDVGTSTLLKTLTGHMAKVSRISFSPDGLTLASGYGDGTVLLWDIDNSSNVSTPKNNNPFIIPESNIDSNSDENILIEKEIAYQNRTFQIKQVCDERGIKTLIHFTRIENLQSILQEGLLGRSLLEARRQDFLFNDNDRVDGHKDAVCLSISFPNYQMFYHIREQKKGTQEANDSQWIVLLLDSKVLWELKCAFCQRNAAHKAVTSILLEDRKRPEALKGMFEDFYDIKHQDLSIPQDYPTHPQAEVLVFDAIPVRYIKAIHFWDAAAQDRWLPSSTDANYEIFCTNRHYFEPRRDYKVWKSANFNNEGIPLSYTANNEVDNNDDIPIEDTPF